MANMSYCRFENTVSDLRDCLRAMREESLEEFNEDASAHEKGARVQLVRLARKIAEEFGDEAPE